jgi:hypothetical protein
MSVLETPRIYFKGEVSWDPITTNNYAANYDEDTGEAVFSKTAGNVQKFREQAIAAIATGNWNPFGTHRVTFFNSAVCGFDSGSGLNTTDPFMDAAVGLNAMLVDLEPYGTFSSQLFFDSMHFGVDGGYRILAPRTSRITARYINFTRFKGTAMIAGVASVVWQTSFPKTGGLRVDAFDSGALNGIRQALDSEDVIGLTVRFNAYRTIYFDNAKLTKPTYGQGAMELLAKLKSGGFQPNPARSLMVGVIGLWRKGEPAHEPGDRPLIQFAVAAPGTAYARIQGDTLTLDLSNSIPEDDDNLKKHDYGTLNIVAVDPISKAITNLGSVSYNQYDHAAYEASAGIVTIPIAPRAAQAASDADLQLRDSSGNVLLAELPLRCIPATPNLYLDEGDHATASFQVFERGVPARSVVKFNLYQTDNGGRPTGSTTVTTDADGVLTMPIAATGGTVYAYVPSFSSADEPGKQPFRQIYPPVNTYMYIRVRPADADIANLPPTWDNVYAKILANWNAMAPCMDNWLKLDDPVQIKTYAALLNRLTDPVNFENFLFMPVTRDMSAGERTLLHKFLDSGPAKPALEAQYPEPAANLSGAMRRL